MPLGEEITGNSSLRTNWVSSSLASDKVTPCADERHRALGRQQHVEAAADLLGCGAAALAPCAGAAAGISTSSSSWKTLKGHPRSPVLVGPTASPSWPGAGSAATCRRGRLEAALDHRADDVGKIGLKCRLIS
jgi:hypothetical protein